MAFTVKSFDQIVSDMVAYMIANSSQLTDISPGSVIRSYCEGAGMSIEEIYVATYLGFRRYLNDVPSVVFDFIRKGGVKATVNVVFSRLGSSGDVTIPAGTRLLTATGIRFLLLADTDIANGNTASASTAVEAEEVGSTYNIAAATLTVIEDPVAGVDAIPPVTNALAATGGVSRETDFQYQQRFKAYVEGLGRSNLAGVRAGALSVEGITSASIKEHFPPITGLSLESGTATTADPLGQTLVDTAADFITTLVQAGHTIVNMTDGSIATVLSVTNLTTLVHDALTDGTNDDWEVSDVYKVYNNNVNATLYVDDGTSGGISDAKLTEVTSEINGDGTEDSPGYRSAGVNVVVAKPTIVASPTTDVEVTIVPLSGTDNDQIETDIVTALTSYVNLLGIGDNIIYSKLMEACSGVYGVTDSDVTVPSANIAISATQVGRLGDVTVTFA